MMWEHTSLFTIFQVPKLVKDKFLSLVLKYVLIFIKRV